MVVITSRSPLLATITAPAQLPRPSAHQLRRRQTIYSDLWATCGYADGDPGKDILYQKESIRADTSQINPPHAAPTVPVYVK